MKISAVRIAKYKSIDKGITLNPGDHLSVFVGKNNSGKSTILDALFRFFRPLQNPERFIDAEAKIDIDLSLTERDRSELSKLGEPNLPEHITLSLYGEEASFRTDNEQKSFSKPVAQFLIQKTVRIGAIRDLDFIKMKKLYEEFQTGWQKAFKLFTSTMLLFFPDVKISSNLFKEKRNGFETSVKEFGKIRTLERLGLGFRHLFIILLYYFHPRYDVLLIDEPEIHLHPSMIKRLVEVLGSRISNKQIFCTTHSPLFITTELLPNIHRIVHTKESGTAIYSQPEKTPDSNRLLQELNADNSEMFLCDHVILVEGISDRIFLRTLLKRFYTTSKDIKVIPVHGKENIDVYAALLNSFSIPFSVMIDKDGLSNSNSKYIRDALVSAQGENTFDLLKKHGIYVLPFGQLEDHYPSQYRKPDLSKPLAAASVSEAVNKNDLQKDPIKPIITLLDDVVKVSD